MTKGRYASRLEVNSSPLHSSHSSFPAIHTSAEKLRKSWLQTSTTLISSLGHTLPVANTLIHAQARTHTSPISNPQPHNSYPINPYSQNQPSTHISPSPSTPPKPKTYPKNSRPPFTTSQAVPHSYHSHISHPSDNKTSSEHR